VLGIAGVVAVVMSGEKDPAKVAADDGSTKPVDTTKPVDNAKPIDSAKPVDTAKPVDNAPSAASADDAKPADRAKPVDAKPAEHAKPDGDGAKLADHAKPDAAKVDDGAAKVDEGAAKVDKSAAEVEVAFDSKPGGATVVVAGQELGATPLKARVAAGAASIVFKLDGYLAKTVNAKLVDGGAVTATLIAIAKPISASKPAPKAAATTTKPAASTTTATPATAKPAEASPDIKDGALINPFAKKKTK
jgi:hypothetical protein